MNKQKNRLCNTKFFTGKCVPMLFCTPAQTSALLSEKRQLIFLIRHGTTDWNVETRLQGRVEVPLNEKGRQQAESCALGLKRAFEGTLSVKSVYSSPLSRAYDTAKIIADAFGHPAPTVAEGLIERDYGSVTGMTYAARRELFKSAAGYPDDMESAADAAVRMKRTIAKVRSDTCDGALILVTHGGILNSFFSGITCRRAGSGGNIVANCTVEIVAAGARDVIPIAFNLGCEELAEFVSELRI
ncbi:MAG: histidine phosphatase family protein [Clostridia bacterium]|nr:histidine phosphatase family protein [Clostridia bacterium]